MISTGYELPFRFVYSAGVWASDGPSYLQVRYANVDGVDNLKAAVDAFAVLASSGALCGAVHDPARSTLTLRLEAARSSDELLWVVERALVCDEALVVLAHLLFATRAKSGIQSVQVVHQSGQRVTLAHDPQLDSTFPPRYRDLGFRIEDDELQADAFAFEIGLETPLEPDHERWLNDMLMAWVRVVELGGFGSAPVPPETGYVEPDEAVISYERTIEWALYKLRADEACIDSLINGLAAFHRRCQRIRYLVIQ